jgi:hypothetical protein
VASVARPPTGGGRTGGHGISSRERPAGRAGLADERCGAARSPRTHRSWRSVAAVGAFAPYCCAGHIRCRRIARDPPRCVAAGRTRPDPGVSGGPIPCRTSRIACLQRVRTKAAEGQRQD